MHIHTCTHAHLHTYAPTHLRRDTETQRHRDTETQRHRDTRTHTYTHVHTRTHTYTHVHTHIHSWTRGLVDSYTRTFVHSYTRTHKHTYKGMASSGFFRSLLAVIASLLFCDALSNTTTGACMSLYACEAHRTHMNMVHEAMHRHHHKSRAEQSREDETRPGQARPDPGKTYTPPSCSNTLFRCYLRHLCMPAHDVPHTRRMCSRMASTLQER